MMFDIGFFELLLLFVVGLLVVGPERMPAMARQLGAWMGKAKRIVAEFRGDVEKELQWDEVKESLRKEQKPLEELRSLVDRVKNLNSDAGSTHQGRSKTPSAPKPFEHLSDD